MLAAAKTCFHMRSHASRFSNWTHLSSYVNPAVRVLRKRSPATRPTAAYISSDASPSDLCSTNDPRDDEEEDMLLVGDAD